MVACTAVEAPHPSWVGSRKGARRKAQGHNDSIYVPVGWVPAVARVMIRSRDVYSIDMVS